MTTYRKIEVDPAQVEELASRGMTHDQVAAALGISPRTLGNRKADNEEIRAAFQKGRARGISSVTGKLFEKAMEGNTTCMIFYLKAIAGWRDVQAVAVEQAEKEPFDGQEEFADYLKKLPTPAVDILTALLYAGEQPEMLPDMDVLWMVDRLWKTGRHNNHRYVLAEVAAGADPASGQLVAVTPTECERRMWDEVLDEQNDRKREAAATPASAEEDAGRYGFPV